MKLGAVATLAADPFVASRDVLLDTDHVAERLRHLLGDDAVDIEHCRLRRVKYRVGESLRVVYDVGLAGRDVVMSARTFANSHAAFISAAQPAVAHERLTAVAHDPETSSVWWIVPNDRKLRNMAALLDAPPRVRNVSGVAWDRSALVEYSPERSATARVLDARGGVVGFAKAYCDRDVLDIAAHYNRVATALAPIGVRTPQAIGCAGADRIVVLEPMPGVAWTALAVDDQQVAMRRFGASIGHVHGLRMEVGLGPFQRYHLAHVANSADIVGRARPDVAAAAQHLRNRLSCGPPNTSAPVYLHGDVHADNALFDGDQVHLIDFDQAGSGAAAADLGSMIASLMTRRLIGSEFGSDGLGAALLDGYRSVRALPEIGELRWYIAAALVVERSIRAVNRMYVPTLAVLAELIELAEATLDGTLDVDG